MITKIVFVSLFTASLNHFIMKCFEEDMIFRRYYLLLIRLWIKWYKKKDRLKRKMLKPIGLCVYCYGTWISIFTFLLLFNFNIVYLLLFIGMNYLWIEIIFKIKSL